MPCDGNDPRTTAKVGQVKLKRKNRGKSIERIEITLVAVRLGLATSEASKKCQANSKRLAY